MLVVFQILGMAIPLLTLPFVARALGVAEFGKVMLAQAIVFFGVVFVDAGFNTESQRRVALARDNAQSLQVLYDNLLTRSVCAVPAIAIMIAMGFFFKDVPALYVVVASLHILGTLAFPQWWLIASNLGLQMGFASTAGRLLAMVLTLLLVRTPDDGLMAVAATSSGTLWAGLLFAPVVYRRWRALAAPVDRQNWRKYLQAVRPTILSGFFSSASASTPAVLLGWISGVTQVGVFTAADRLTRSAAHLIGVIEQTLMGQLARTEQSSAVRGKALRKRLLLLLAWVTGAGCMLVGFLAYFFVQMLYGEKFATVTPVLQTLCMWLWLYAMRRAVVLFTWSLRGNLVQVSRFQWLEAASVTVCAALGAYCAAAFGLAVGLVGSELALSLLLLLSLRRNRLQT
jgi:polysaccharide transporter, PST family